jgi:hypothetical protein
VIPILLFILTVQEYFKVYKNITNYLKSQCIA